MFSWIKNFGAWTKREWNKDASGKLLIFLLYFFVVVPLVLGIVFLALALVTAGVILVVDAVSDDSDGPSKPPRQRMTPAPFIPADDTVVCARNTPAVRSVRSSAGFPY